jgi:hypothetical protein
MRRLVNFKGNKLNVALETIGAVTPAFMDIFSVTVGKDPLS